MQDTEDQQKVRIIINTEGPHEGNTGPIIQTTLTAVLFISLPLKSYIVTQKIKTGADSKQDISTCCEFLSETWNLLVSSLTFSLPHDTNSFKTNPLIERTTGDT